MLSLTRTKLIITSYLLLALPLWAQPADNPRLIDITTLDQLYAIRYDLDGNGTPAGDAAAQAAYRTAFGTPSCVSTSSCAGYELMNDLDFNDADGSGAGTAVSKWAKNCVTGCVTGTRSDGTSGNTGWEPIGYYILGTETRYTSRFHGNERTIRNLYVNRRSAETIYGGLFGSTPSATLDSLGLRDVEVKVESTGSYSYAGGLLGQSDGSSITACYVTGDVTSTSTYSYAGGLVGLSYSNTSITACYATGDVISTGSNSRAGGLVGVSGVRSSIKACYATGDVISTGSNSYAGGLVGWSSGSTSITACYATGDVSGRTAGGLLGQSDGSSITASYYTSEATVTNTGSGGTNTHGSVYTRAQLQAAPAYDYDHDSNSATDVLFPMASWNIDVDGDGSVDDPWDFGTTNEYPKLKPYSNAGGGGGTGGGGTGGAVPDAPTGLVATTVSGIEISLSWQAPTNTGGAEITGYKIQFSSPDASNFRDLLTTSGSTTTYQHTSLAANTEYYYQVAAINSVDQGAYSSSVSATTPAVPPAAPTNLTATPASGSQINLVWQSPTNTGGVTITGYQLQFSTNGTVFNNLSRTSGSTTTYQHTGLTADTEYHYQVAAINSVDRGAYSSSVSATTHDVPGVPRGLTATPVDDTKIDLAWQAPTNTGGTAITGYHISFSTSGGGSFTVDGSTFTYRHTGLEAGDTYHYQIAAVNSVGRGAYSNTVSATVRGTGGTNDGTEPGTGGGDGGGNTGGGGSSDTATFGVSEEEEALRLYPNPTSGVVRFRGLSATRSYLYKAYSLAGEEVLSGRLRSGEVDVSSLSSGQYIFVLEDEEGNEVLRRRLLVLK